jgi:hypothetical protein
VKIIHHEKTTPQEVLAQPSCIFIAELPAARLDGVQHWIVEYVLVGDRDKSALARRSYASESIYTSH